MIPVISIRVRWEFYQAITMTKHFSRHFWCVAYSQQLLYTVPGAFQVDTKFIPRSFPSSLQGHSKVIPSSFQVHSKCSPSSFLVHILSIALTCITVLVQKRWAHLESFIALAVWQCGGAHSKCIVTLTMHSQVQWLACAAEAAAAHSQTSNGRLAGSRPVWP